LANLVLESTAPKFSMSTMSLVTSAQEWEFTPSLIQKECEMRQNDWNKSRFADRRCFRLITWIRDKTTALAMQSPYIPDVRDRSRINLSQLLSPEAHPIALVVEDEIALCNVIRIILERSGFRTVTAHGGLEAMALFRERLKSISLLVTDVELGGWPNGIELAEQILRAHPETAILVVSGQAFEALASKKQYSFLRKPFTPLQLEDSVRELLASSKPAVRRAARGSP
jgi:CheY-like chemotaxis protein